MTSAVILGMIVTMFPEPREQAKAIGVFAFVASAGGSIGLLAGGVITQSINWHWIFFINLPIGIATAVMARRLLEHDKGTGFGEGADFPGAFLVTAGLMLLVYTMVKPAVDDGWGAGSTLAFGAASLLLFALFIVREATARNPLMPLRIFRSRNVAGANVLQALLVPGMFGTFFLGALYLQRVLGYDPLQIGFAFLPATITMGGLSFKYTERLITRFGAVRTLTAGIVVLLAALLLFTQTPVDGGYALHIFPVVTLMGIGAGLAFPALMTLAMSSATPADAGLASGLVNTSAQVGGALGLALLATIAATRTSHLKAAGESMASALNGGYHTAYLVGAGLTVVALIIAVTVLQPVPKPGEAPAEASERAGQPAFSEA